MFIQGTCKNRKPIETHIFGVKLCNYQFMLGIMIYYSISADYSKNKLQSYIPSVIYKSIWIYWDELQLIVFIEDLQHMGGLLKWGIPKAISFTVKSWSSMTWMMTGGTPMTWGSFPQLPAALTIRLPFNFTKAISWELWGCSETPGEIFRIRTGEDLPLSSGEKA